MRGGEGLRFGNWGSGGFGFRIAPEVPEVLRIDRLDILVLDRLFRGRASGFRFRVQVSGFGFRFRVSVSGFRLRFQVPGQASGFREPETKASTSFGYFGSGVKASGSG